MPPEIIRISPSPPRRFILLGMLLVLGGMLVWLGFSASGAPVWQVALVATGAALLALLPAVNRIGRMGLVLTETALHDTDGREVCSMANVARVERGAFAFKPSNGFMIKLTRPEGPTLWRPGLYWRAGRRVGVGGILPASLTKIMAEEISARIGPRTGP